MLNKKRQTNRLFHMLMPKKEISNKKILNP